MTYLQLEQIQKEHDGKVCIFGTGLIGRTWGYDVLVAAGFTIDFYYDNRLKCGEEIFAGIKTIDFDTLCEYKKDIIVSVTVTEKYHAEIKEQLERAGIKNYFMLGFNFLQDFCVSVTEAQDEAVIEKYKAVVDDACFLKRQFDYRMGYGLNLENPKTFNEKLQWLKLNDRKPEYTKLVDKYEFKEYVKSVLGEEYIIPTIGVWNKPEDIEWDRLPKQFVLKCTHDSGSVVICRDKKNFDVDTAIKKLKSGLKQNYYWIGREWPYKNVKPKIIAEEYVCDSVEKELRDYKFYCFNGHAEALLLATDRQSRKGVCFDYFDREFRYLGWVNHWHSNAKILPCKPVCFEEMRRFAEKMSKGFPHVRIDFYQADNRIYVGEFTLYDMAGFLRIHPDEWDLNWGSLIDLNLVK